jgi:hypothetical protein
MGGSYCTHRTENLKERDHLEDIGIGGIIIWECIQKFPDWLDKETYAYNNEH